MAISPARLSAVLRSVADRISRSERPSRSAVASELRRVLAAMETDDITGLDENTIFSVLTNGGTSDEESLRLDSLSMLKKKAEVGEPISGSPFDDLEDHGISVIPIDDGSTIGLNVSFEGDGDFPYQSDYASYSPKDAAKALFKELSAIVAGLSEDEE